MTLFKRLHLYAVLLLSAVSLVNAQAIELEQTAIYRESAWESRQWLKLGHYKKTYFSGYQSRIASKEFFLSPVGQSSPKDELLATARLLLNGKSESAGQPINCIYPARTRFIQKLLAKDKIKLKLAVCPRFEKWSQAINAEALTLVFPSAFMNNPASMFGHTLLRLDRFDQDETTRMLAYSVNFEANTEGEGALIYAFKGVFGGFFGLFSLAPYYEKLKKYSDLESRDIWEYQLKFSKPQIDILVAHLWELREAPFYYYYFDENCSYQLLALLEVANPKLHLTEKFAAHVIPVDTVKVIVSQSSMVKERYFRPSNASRLRSRISGTSTKLQNKALECQTKCDVSGLSNDQQATVLDLAHDYLDLQRLKVKGDSSTEEQQLLGLLTQRSQLGDMPNAIAEVIQNPLVDPAESHGTARLSTYLGVQDSEQFYDLELRPAFHDLLDRLSGYQPGAGIDFLDLGLRVSSNESLRLNKFNILNIASISPRDKFFTPISWHFATGLIRQQIAEQQKLQYLTTLAVGPSKEINGLIVSAQPLISIALSSHYNDNVDLQPGWQIGLLRQSENGTSFNPSVIGRWSTLDSTDFSHKYLLPISYPLSQNLAIRAEFEREFNLKVGSTFRAGLNFYW